MLSTPSRHAENDVVKPTSLFISGKNNQTNTDAVSPSDDLNTTPDFSTMATTVTSNKTEVSTTPEILPVTETSASVETVVQDAPTKELPKPNLPLIVKNSVTSSTPLAKNLIALDTENDRDSETPIPVAKLGDSEDTEIAEDCNLANSNTILYSSKPRNSPDSCENQKDTQKSDSCHSENVEVVQPNVIKEAMTVEQFAETIHLNEMSTVELFDVISKLDELKCKAMVALRTRMSTDSH